VASIPLLSNLSNPIALSGLALLVPIIILYLLKPKPKLILFPSTMFIRFIEKNKRFASFLQRFIHDPILILQLLIITLLVLSIVNPFYMSKEQLKEEESVVIVVDASASMQATDVKPTRFDAAIAKGREIITELNEKDDVSIILARNIPAVISTKGTREDAMLQLSNLAVSDTPTDTGDALMLAKDMLANSDRKKAVYILSDFAPSGGLDIRLARRIAAASGVRVELLKIGDSSDNAGITAIEAKRSSVNDNQLYLTVNARNFRPAGGIVAKVYSGDSLLDSQQMDVQVGGDGFFYFKPNITNGEQMLSVRLDGQDSLLVDDTAYAWLSPARMSRVLLLTSEGSDKFLKNLMIDSLVAAKKIDFQYAVPPVIPDVSGFDAIIVGNAQNEKILPGMFRDIKNSVKNGATLVVIGTEGLSKIGDADLWSIMPVDMIGTGSRETGLTVLQEHEMLNDVAFDNVVAKKYYNMRVRDNDTKVLVGAELFDNPMIAYRQYGDGYVVYMGVNSEQDWSNLYYSSSFPIFWYQMMKYVTHNRETTNAIMQHTGEYLQVGSTQKVQMPGGLTVNSASIYLDKAGVYSVEYPDRTEKVTANLLDGAETNITGSSVAEMEDGTSYKVQYEDVNVKVDLFRRIMMVMLFAILVETFLYRRRGLL